MPSYSLLAKSPWASASALVRRGPESCRAQSGLWIDLVTLDAAWLATQRNRRRAEGLRHRRRLGALFTGRRNLRRGGDRAIGAIRDPRVAVHEQPVGTAPAGTVDSPNRCRSGRDCRRHCCYLTTPGRGEGRQGLGETWRPRLGRRVDLGDMASAPLATHTSCADSAIAVDSSRPRRFL